MAADAPIVPPRPRPQVVLRRRWMRCAFLTSGATTLLTPFTLLLLSPSSHGVPTLVLVGMAAVSAAVGLVLRFVEKPRETVVLLGEAGRGSLIH